MALSEKAKRRFEVAMARRQEAQEIIDAIEAAGGSITPAADVNDISLAAVGTTDGSGSDAALAADVDGRLGDVESTINGILASLRNAGLMA